MPFEEAVERLVNDITEVGLLTSDLARRYEGMFGGFRRELETALGQTSTIEEAAETVLLLVEAGAAALRSSFPHQSRIDCKDGCSACCHLFVAVPPGTASVIAAHVRTHFDRGNRDALMIRLAEAAAVLASAGNPLLSRVRCPLLGEDDRCTIYAVRPLACRAFTSRSVSRCQSFIFEEEPSAHGGVEQNPAHYRLHMVATECLQSAARARGQPAEQRGLVQSLYDELGA